MQFRATSIVGGVLLGAAVLPAFACTLPTLPVIPAKDAIGDQAATVSAATGAYFDGMRAYATCIEADLAAAGGDAAPASMKSAVAARGRAAVAEAQAIQKLFQASVGAGQTATPGSEDALRKLLAGLASGMPDYDAMTPEFARVMRQQLGFLQPPAAAAGAIQSVEFAGIDTEGRNIFQVHHEHGTTNARIALDADGKIEFALLRPVQTGPTERRPTATLGTRPGQH